MSKIATAPEKGKEIKMDKNIKFSERPMKEKIIYAIVVGILCVSAIVVGIVSVANKKVDELPEDTPPANEGGENESGAVGDTYGEEDNTPTVLTFSSPLVGEIAKSHSTDAPVFSDTLGEWRIHTGNDIRADEGATVYAAAAGAVTGVYNDPLLGRTVEITHEGGIVSCYSNLDSAVSVQVGDTVTAASAIGKIGDTSLTELADEPHLHFEMKVNGVSVNPLDYLSEESKSASLGIVDL